jgi:cell fate (sporulation/competence/biofilm development) regulator YlbF (YheA/YmcA/DUF963 family)
MFGKILNEVKKMNVYDCANDLGKALRASREYDVLKAAKDKLSTDSKAKAMVKEFLLLSQEIEIAKYQKQDVPSEKKDKLQQLSNLLNLNHDAMEYLNAFMRFQMMMQDVTKTITDVVKEVTD